MANENIISWNIANWITVGLIGLTMFAAFGLIQKYAQQKVNAQQAA
jgi:hypothetical protein